MKIKYIFCLFLCLFPFCGCQKKSQVYDSEPPKAFQFYVIVAKQAGPIDNDRVIGEFDLCVDNDPQPLLSATMPMSALQYTEEGYPMLLCEFMTFDDLSPDILIFKMKCPALFGDTDMHIIKSYWTPVTNYLSKCKRVVIDGSSCLLTSKDYIITATYIPKD